KEPYASARRVFWIVDNGSFHRGQASIDRLQGRWPNLALVHTPVHASWLNRVGAGLAPAPPTPPGMRVRTRRFAQHARKRR
ncbi:MAG: transposase, partial [Actinomycetota bacterium]|nr:transposase [Actinomycetota bacterium]